MKSETTIVIPKNHKYTNDEVKSVLNMAFGDVVSYEATDKHDVFKLKNYRGSHRFEELFVEFLSVPYVKIDGSIIGMK